MRPIILTIIFFATAMPQILNFDGRAQGPAPTEITELGDESWFTKEIDHFIYHFLKDYPPDNTTLRISEEHLNRIASLLQVEFNDKINCYLAPSKELRQKLTDQMKKSDRSDRPIIVALVMPTAHDIALAVQLATLGNSSALFQEGFATYCENPQHLVSYKLEPIHLVAKRLLFERETFDFTKLISAASFEDPADRFVAGSFIGYLIESKDLETFKQFYKLAEDIQLDQLDSRSVYVRSFSQLIIYWQNFLKGIYLSEEQLWKGRKLIHDRKLDEAIDALKMALSHDPTNFDARYELAKLYEVQENSDLAKAEYEQLGKSLDRKWETLLGDIQEKLRQQLAEKRFVTDDYWLFIGPYDNTDGVGHNKVYPPEERIILDQPHQTKSGLSLWRASTPKSEKSGFVNLLPLFSPNQDVVAYALTFIESPEERSMQIRAGSDDGIKVWLNDELVLDRNAARAAEADQDVVQAKLKAGKNKVLLKITQGRIDWGFYFRITDLNGKPDADLKPQLPKM